MRRLFPVVLSLAGLFPVGLLASPLAQAQVYVSSSPTVYLRTATEVLSGPGVGYPSVEYLAAGEAVNLHGCLSARDWCDVSTRFSRGWVPSNALVVYSNRQYYDLESSRSWVAYPVLTFVFDRYWYDHYRNREWYRHRDRYRHHPGHWNRPGPGPYVRDRDRDGVPDHRERSRHRDARHREGRRDWRHGQDQGKSPRSGERDYRGLPRRNDSQGDRDYRGLPRREGGVGNLPHRPDVPASDVRRPRLDVPSPDAGQPGSPRPPRNQFRDRQPERATPAFRGRNENRTREGPALQVE